MRMFVDVVLNRSASLGASGVDEIRWRAPVRPGDTLTVTLTVLETKASERHPERGSVRSRFEMRNQAGETVMTLSAVNLFLRRPPGS